MSRFFLNFIFIFHPASSAGSNRLRMGNDQDWYDPAQVKKGGPMEVKVPRIADLLERDPYIRNHEREIRRR